MKLSFEIDDAFVQAIRERLPFKNDVEMLQEAFSALYWMGEETEQGRLILSSDKDGKNPAKFNSKSIVLKEYKMNHRLTVTAPIKE